MWWLYPICSLQPLRFSMLKAWVQNQDVGEIEIEEKYVVFVRTLRTDRYTTVRAPFKKNNTSLHHHFPTKCWVSRFSQWLDLPYPLGSPSKVTIFQLEKIYGKGPEARACIQELCRGSLAMGLATYYMFLVIYFLESMMILEIKVRLACLIPRPGLVVLVSPGSLPVWCLASVLPGPQREKGENVQGLTRSGRGKPKWHFSWDLCFLVLVMYALARAYTYRIWLGWVWFTICLKQCIWFYIIFQVRFKPIPNSYPRLPFLVEFVMEEQNSFWQSSCRALTLPLPNSWTLLLDR